MSRGTKDFTVQQLIEFLYDEEQRLKRENEALHDAIGKAYLADNEEWMKLPSRRVP